MFKLNCHIISVLALFLTATIASGDTFVVPLSVTGSYSCGQSKAIEFDLGVPLLQVNSAYFVCSGSVTAGLDYWFLPYGDKFACFLNAEPHYMFAEGPTVGAFTWPSPQFFSGQYLFEPFFGSETWNFLLDGHATGWVELEGIAYLPEFPPYSFPTGYLSSASIIIDAIPLTFPSPGPLASYEPTELLLSVTTDPAKDPTLTATWPVCGDVNDVPPATDANNVLKMRWTGETDRKVEVKHTWTNFTFDLSDKEWLLADVYFDNLCSIPSITGLWDDVFGWVPAICVPDTTGEWHTLLFYVGNLDYNDLNHIYAFVFEDLPCDAGRIYIDNLRFGSLEDILPRIIAFSGYDWWLKDTGCGRAGPGSNYFSDSNQNVWLDANEQLHLKIAHRADKWYCSEVVSSDSLGYGTHAFTVKGRIDVLDPNVVLGLFTWDTNAPQYNYREIDFEFSRWWDTNEANNAQYVIQPWYIEGNRHRFHINCGPNDLTTHEIKWLPDRICFKSYYGEYPLLDSNNLIESWSYIGSYIPPAGGENDRMNLWLLQPLGSPQETPGGPPADGNEVEVIIRSFKFMPLGDFNSDGYVNMIDLGMFMQAWLTSPGSQNWNPDCEMAVPHNGVIDFHDFAVFAGNWKKGKGL